MQVNSKIPFGTTRIAGAVIAMFTVAGAAVAQDKEAPVVEVISTTPIPGLGSPINEIPANVQSATAKDLQRSQAIDLPDFMQQNIPSVNISDVQGNPFQPQVNYRGFSSSPLLGEPQGLSVFQDGVRINETFGDVVNWDLIPQNAIADISLIPGSNPLFGLNTLGGALSVQTKTGRLFPNTEIEAYGGSWGRWSVQAEHGGYAGENDYFLSGNIFQENGWRDDSPSKVKQFFTQFGHHDAKTDIHLSLTAGNTDLTGNGVAPESMLQQRREQVFTVPDNTRNEMYMANLTASHWLSDSLQVAGNMYARRNRTSTLNGDANDDFEGSANDGSTGANGGAGFNQDTAVDNRTRTIQTTLGIGVQLSHVLDRNRFTVGTSIDSGRSDFVQSSTEGIFNTDRSVLETEDEQIQNSLFGTTRTSSIFATDTYTITQQLLVTVSGRFNHTEVKTQDRLNSTPPNLDGDFTYNKFNPAVGLNYNPNEALNTWLGWSQGNRAPSPIELGCADPNNPCTLPNALASDPYLNQVVSRTWELGARGKVAPNLGWSAAVYRTQNANDILFVSTGTSAGYFTNFGKTQRQGVELGFNGQWRNFRWGANYAYVDATFKNGACLLSANNSSAGTGACPGEDDIEVKSGDKLPGIPKHQFNLNLDYSVNDKWSVGATISAFSSQFARGNENNQHQAGTFTDNFGNTRTFLGSGEAGGYMLLNLSARFRFAPQWEVFAKVNNVFDRDYSTSAILAENPFDAAGAFQTNSDNWAHETFFGPGAPRAGWIGVRYTIERTPGK